MTATQSWLAYACVCVSVRIYVCVAVGGGCSWENKVGGLDSSCL